MLFFALRYRRALFDPEGDGGVRAPLPGRAAEPQAILPSRNTPRGNRTPATGVKGPRANRYTMGAGGLESRRGGAQARRRAAR
jgi:hypothetical protein